MMFRGRKQQIAESSQKLKLARQLCESIENGQIATCKKFLDEGGDSNLLLPDRAVTPFHLAVGSDAANSKSVVELCLQYGANPNIRASEGLTPLHVSAIWGKADILKILLKNGGNPSLKDENGESALDLAVENNQPECVKVLLDFEKCNNVRLSLTSLSLGNDSFIIKKLNSNGSLIIPKTPTFSEPLCCRRSPSEENGCTNPADTSFRLRRSNSDSLFSRSYSTSFNLDKHLSKSASRTSSSSLHSKSMFDIEIERSSSQNTTLPKRNSCKKLDFDLRNITYNEDSESAYVTCIEASSNATPCITTPYSHGLVLSKSTPEDEIESYGTAFSPAEIVSCDPDTKEKVVRILDSPSMDEFECRAVGDYTVIRKHSFLNNDKEDDLDFLTSSPFTSLQNVDLDDSIEQLRNDIKVEKYKKDEDFNDDENDTTNDYEEFVYVDKDEGIKLIERRTPTVSINSTDADSSVYVDCTAHSWKQFSHIKDYLTEEEDDENTLLSLEVDVMVPPEIEKLSDAKLREILISLGDDPGPITKSTRSIYELRLTRLQQYPKKYLKQENNDTVYSRELQQVIEGKYNPAMMKELESKMKEIFDGVETPKKQWREGRVKNCFSYLLLDPRVTLNLPLRSTRMTSEEQFKTFLASIFYIGKGKRTRPYSHLYEAVHLLRKGKVRNRQTSRKLQHILNIWADGAGVISLHVFQNVIPVEAYTREACMVDAIGRLNVTNLRNGEVYGSVKSWTGQKKRYLGAFMLQRACNIFINEGERQIRPADM